MLNKTMDDDSENACDLCKISYSSETELREHIWSLMHHIKIEQKRKGSVHNCTLCYATCENIIAFGKHLNEERHKKAVEESRRRGKESDDELETETVSEKESSQGIDKEEHDTEKENADNENYNPGKPVQSVQYTSVGSSYQPYGYRDEHRTYSGINYDDHYRKDHSNKYWYGDNSYYKQHRGQHYNNTPQWNYEDFHWHQTGYGSDHYQTQWDQWIKLGNYDMSQQKNGSKSPWNQRRDSRSSWQYDSQPGSSYEYNQGSWNADGGTDEWNQYSQADPNSWVNDWSQNVDQSEWYQDSSEYNSPAYNSNLITCGGDVDDKVAKDEDKNWKGSRKADEKMDTTESYSKQRGRNQKRASIPKGRNRDRLSQSVDSASSKRCRKQNWEESFSKSLRSDRTDSGLHSLTQSCKKGKHKGLVVKLPMPEGKHRLGGGGNSREPDSTTGSSVADLAVLSASRTSTLSDSSHDSLRNRLTESNGSELSFSRSLISKGLKKTKMTKKVPAKVSPRMLKKTVRKTADTCSLDKGATILQKAEKLCKELREKREVAKVEKEKREKQKKQKEINKQIQTLSEINKSYVTGKLTAPEDNFAASLSKDQSTDASHVSSLNMESLDSSKSSRKDIERIRQEIEKSVQEERNSSKSSLQASETIGERGILKDQLKSKPLDKEKLLKLINSPRSRKERLKLSEMLSKYSKSQKKLSMPRFNLKMSGLYDSEDISLEEINYDDLSPDLQLQIAELLQHDTQIEFSELNKIKSSMQMEVKTEIPDITEYTCTSVSNTEEQSDKVDSLRKEIKCEKSNFPTSSETVESVMATSALKLSDLSVDFNDCHVCDVIPEKDSNSSVPYPTSDLPIHPKKSKKSKGRKRNSHEKATEAIEKVALKMFDVNEIEQDISNMKVLASSDVSVDLPVSSCEVLSNSVERDSLMTEIIEVTSSNFSKPLCAEVEKDTTPILELVTSTDTETICQSDKEQDVKQTTDPVTNIFEHIYNISLREEQVRQQIASLDSEIENAKKIIENAAMQLGMCGEKRKTLLAEEESLRSKRLKILEDAHSSNLGTSSDYSVTRASSVATSVAPILFDKPENETNQKIDSKGDNTTSNSIICSTSQSANLSQYELLDTECDLKIESIVCMSEDELKQSYDNHDNTNKTTTPDYHVTGYESAHASSTLSPSKNNMTLQMEPEKDMCIDLKQECVSSDELSRQESNVDHRSDSPKACSDSPSVSKKKANLEAAGFVTLSSLMDGHCSPVHKNETPLPESEQGMDGDLKSQIDEFTKSTDSDDLNSSGDQDCASRKYLMEFMGSIPGIDSASFLKQFASLPSSMGVTYMLMDKQISGNTLEKLQTVLKDRAKGRPDSVESTASSPNEHGSMDIDIKPDLESLIDDASYNYDSVASNCSLGEKIRKYCRLQVQEQCSEPNIESVGESESMLAAQESSVNGSVQTLKTCSVVVKHLEVDQQSIPEKDMQDSINEDIVDNSSGREVVNKPPNSPPRPPTPNKKKLKSKKERDKKSVRKQKEEFILPSSSDGNSDDDMPLQAVKLKLHSLKNSKEEQQAVQSVKQISEFSEESDLPKLTAPKSRLTRKKTDLQTELMKDTEHSTKLQSEEEEKTTLLEGVQLDTGSQTESESIASEDGAKCTLPSDNLKLRADVDSLCCTVENTVNPSKPVQFLGPAAPVIDLQVFCDKLYICYQSNQICKYNLVTGKCVMEYSFQGLSVNCLLITSLESPRVRMFAGGASMRLLVFNTQKSEMVKSEEMDDKIQCLHQDWGKLFIGLGSGDIVAWNLKQEKRISEFQCSDRPVSCITSATEGTRKLLLVGSQDFFIYICDANTGLLLRLLKGHSKTPYCIQVDGHTVYSASGDKTVIVSDLLTGEEQYKYKDHRGIVTGLLLYDNMVLTSSYDKLIRCFHKKEHSILKMYYGAGRGVITRMTLWNDKIVSGNREGLAEAVSLKVNHNCSCQYKNCKLVFGYDAHLLHHIMTDHILVNCRTYRCQWKGCNEWITSDQGKQNITEHLRSHIANITS